MARIYQVDMQADTLDLGFVQTINIDSLYSYAWMAPGSIFPVALWQNSVTYEVEITNGIVTSNTKTDESVIFSYNPDYQTTSVDNPAMIPDIGFKIYPTTTKSALKIWIDGERQEHMVLIYDHNGRLVHHLEGTSQQLHDVDVSEFYPGKYYVSIDGLTHTFIKVN
jgi:hypothetical protein